MRKMQRDIGTWWIPAMSHMTSCQGSSGAYATLQVSTRCRYRAASSASLLSGCAGGADMAALTASFSIAMTAHSSPVLEDSSHPGYTRLSVSHTASHAPACCLIEDISGCYATGCAGAAFLNSRSSCLIAPISLRTPDPFKKHSSGRSFAIRSSLFASIGPSSSRLK